MSFVTRYTIPRWKGFLSRLFLDEVLNLLFGLFPGVAIAFLHPADQYVGVAFDGIDVIAGQTAPAILDFTLQLLPFTSNYNFVQFACSLSVSTNG